MRQGGIRSEMNTLEGQQEWHKHPRNYRKPTEIVRTCEKNERGAHSEKNARCGHTGGKKNRAAKPKGERCVKDRYDRGGAERGQRNKQDSMEEEANQLYR